MLFMSWYNRYIFVYNNHNVKNVIKMAIKTNICNFLLFSISSKAVLEKKQGERK